MSTGSGLFSFLCGIFDQIFGQIIPIIISIGTVTNAKASATLVTVHMSTNLLIIERFSLDCRKGLVLVLVLVLLRPLVG